MVWFVLFIVSVICHRFFLYLLGFSVFILFILCDLSLYFFFWCFSLPPVFFLFVFFFSCFFFRVISQCVYVFCLFPCLLVFLCNLSLLFFSGCMVDVMCHWLVSWL